MISIIQAAGWPIWPLILCSIAALALIIERLSSLRPVRVAPAKLLDEVLAITRQSLPNEDVIRKLADNSVLGSVLAAGIRAASQDHVRDEAQLRQSFEAAGRAAVHQLERYLNALGTIASAAPLLGPGTVVLSLQNGVGHEDILARHVGRDRVLVGRTYVGGSPLGPGHVIAGYPGKATHIGELDGRLSERVQRVAQAFSEAGLATQVSGNIVGTIWDKLLINVATGAITALTGLTYGQLYAQPGLQALGLAAVQEAMAVARAQGIVLSIQDPLWAWQQAGAGLGADFKTSMLQSLEKGSVTEVDYVNGAVVRLGQALGVATPVNRTLLALVQGIESRLG